MYFFVVSANHTSMGGRMQLSNAKCSTSCELLEGGGGGRVCHMLVLHFE